MTLDTFLTLLVFAFTMTFTPGPNNMMLMASGANFGTRRSLPHAAGVAYGLPVMVVLVGLGVIRLFDIWPVSYTLLKVLSFLYLIWLAWKIANAAQPKTASTQARPLSIWQAAGFQWVNPKAWSGALGAITLYASNQSIGAILLVALAFAMAGTCSTLTWITLGTKVKKFLTNPKRLTYFNWTMAVLLVAAMIPALLRG